jgi:hypothetical protein
VFSIYCLGFFTFVFLHRRLKQYVPVIYVRNLIYHFCDRRPTKHANIFISFDLFPPLLKQRYEYTKLQRSNTTLGVENVSCIGTEGENQTDMVESLDRFASGNDGLRPSTLRLTEDRLRRLEAIGFQWKVKNKMKRYYDKQWDSMFDRLKAFKEINGHCMIPKRYPPDVKLGTWVRAVL